MPVIGTLRTILALDTAPFSRGAKNARGQLGGLTGSLQKFKGPAIAAGSALTAFGVAAVKMAADAERLQASFETLTGSADAARLLLKEIREFSSSTPLQFNELADAAKKLKAFGVDIEEVVPTLRVLGDVAGATGNRIGDIAEIYGKAKVQQRLFAEDINQLTGRGINVIDQFAKQLGVASSEVTKLVSDGKISFDNLRNAMIELSETDFAGGLKRQSETLTGQFSTMRDQITAIMTDIGTSIKDNLELTNAATEVNDELSEFRKATAIEGGLLKPLTQSGAERSTSALTTLFRGAFTDLFTRAVTDRGGPLKKLELKNGDKELAESKRQTRALEKIERRLSTPPSVVEAF